MSNFETTDFGFSTATLAELNTAALAGGEWGCYTSFGLLCTRAEAETKHGYGLALTQTHGCGNRGQLVLTAKSAEAAEYLRQGKARQVMARTGCTYQVADAYVSASKGVKYAFEPSVYTLAVKERHSCGAWLDFKRVGHGYKVDKWCETWQMPRLTGPRLESAAWLALAIAEA